MKQNDREKTVATMDLISLRLGEITDTLSFIQAFPEMQFINEDPYRQQRPLVERGSCVCGCNFAIASTGWAFCFCAYPTGLAQLKTPQ